MTELLTQTKGWSLVAATCTEGYTMNSGAVISDLYNDGYVMDEEKDDIITFNADGFVYWNPGKLQIEGDPTTETTIGKWTLDEENNKIGMQIPQFGITEDSEIENCDLVTLDEKTLKVNYHFTISDDEAKAPGTYTFVLTYEVAK